MVSDFVVPQCGQVMTDSKIMALQRAVTPVQLFGAEGYPASVVARVSAAASVLVSS